MVSDVHAKVDKLIQTVQEKDSKIEDLEKTVLRMADMMKYMKLDLQKNEGARVQLFNMVQKLKGSMRVYVRVKPLDGIIHPTTNQEDEFRLALRASTPTDGQNCINVPEDGVRSDLPISVEL